MEVAPDDTGGRAAARRRHYRASSGRGQTGEIRVARRHIRIRIRHDPHLSDAGHRRTHARPVKNGMHVLGAALEERFHRAVPPVPHPARNAPAARFIAKRVPVADSLDAAEDEDVAGGHCKNVNDAGGAHPCVADAHVKLPKGK